MKKFIFLLAASLVLASSASQRDAFEDQDDVIMMNYDILNDDDILGALIKGGISLARSFFRRRRGDEDLRILKDWMEKIKSSKSHYRDSETRRFLKREDLKD